MSEQESRIVTVLKALGIYAVVSGHYDGTGFFFINAYVFNIPLFFLIGGLVANPEKSGILKKVIWKYGVYSIVSYCILFLCASLLSPYLPSVKPPSGAMTDHLVLFFRTNAHELKLFSVAWFLVAYACVSLAAHFLIPFLPPRGMAAAGIVCCLIGMLYIAPNDVPVKSRMDQIWNLAGQVTVGFGFFMFGRAVRGWIWRYACPLSAFVCFCFLFALYQGHLLLPIGMAWGDYHDRWFFNVVDALLCSFMLLGCARWLAERKMPWIVLEIGRRTKAIMTYHLLVFLVLQAVFVWCGLKAAEQVTLYGAPRIPYTRWLYIGAGMVVPTLCAWKRDEWVKKLCSRFVEKAKLR